MKKLFLNIYRCIVGKECGFTGEGSEQWYYSLSLAINLMLIWWLKPEIALIFTILAVIHYLTVFFFGWFDYGCIIFAYVYFGIHLVLLAIAIFTSLKWAIITIAITTIAFFLAPDYTGMNIFMHKMNYSNSKLALLFNTIIFAAFVIIVVLLPITFWVKLLMIIGALLIHPIIDYIAEQFAIISDVTYDALEEVESSIKRHKKR